MNLFVALLATSLLQPPAKDAGKDDWAAEEHRYLHNVKQVTRDFARAGEGYFAPDGKSIVYQAEVKGDANPFYQIFTQDLQTGKFRRISPGRGRTTCAYFHPNGKTLIFASSHEDPNAKKQEVDELAKRVEEAKAGTRRRYSWDFDPFMKIYSYDPEADKLTCLTPEAKVYTAEGSYSADGKRIVFSRGNAGDVQICTMNADGSDVKAITTAKNCYNGGPFFSPDGTKVIFRSDRKEKDRLQLYVVDSDGKNEKALTNDDKWVYWAPFWYEDGKHIIYTAADHGDESKRPNYDLYWMNIETGKTTRITHAPGQDVLPVFSPDFKKLMWTTSRDGRSPTQLWIADFVPPTESK